MSHRMRPADIMFSLLHVNSRVRGRSLYWLTVEEALSEASDRVSMRESLLEQEVSTRIADELT